MEDFLPTLIVMQTVMVVNGGTHQVIRAGPRSERGSEVGRV